MKRSIRFYSKNPDDYSLFHGYKHKLLDECDMTKIAKFINHIREVVCGGDEKVFKYVCQWFAKLVQIPDAKIRTALVLFSRQGAGKNDAFTNILCELVGYSVKQLTNMDDIVGSFNAVLENHKLIVCDELNDSQASKYLNMDALKGVITGISFRLNEKGLRKRTADNFANFIFSSNNRDAIRIDNHDGRYVFVDMSDKYCSKRDGVDNPLSKPYFDELFKEIDTSGFCDNLLTYFMKVDISDFVAEAIPETQSRKDAQEFSKSSVRLFVEEQIESFRLGYNCEDAYQTFREYCQRNGFSQMNVKTFGLKVKEFATRDRLRRDGARTYVYNLLPEYDLTTDDVEITDVA
jgi:hypothetical protein